MDLTSLAGRALVAVVLITAAVGKSSSRAAFTGFVDSLRNVQVLGPLRTDAWLPIVATAVIGSEFLGGGLGLVFAEPLGPTVSAGILLVFTAGLTVNLTKRIPATCACFGAQTVAVTWRTAVRAALLTLVAVYTLLVPTTFDPIDAVGAVGLCLGASAGLTISFWDVAAPFLKHWLGMNWARQTSTVSPTMPLERLS